MACRPRARAYFDKDVADLTLPEAAYLAVLPKAPSNYDPVRATERALDRRNYVLREMANNGYITEAQRAAAAATAARHDPLWQQRQVPRAGRLFHGGSPPRPDQPAIGETAEDGPNSVYAGGLWVRTSMVPEMQDAAAEALREGLAKFDGGRGWRDTGLSIEADGDWQAQLRVAALGTGFPDWRKAVVLSKSRRPRPDRLRRRHRPGSLPRVGGVAARSAAAAGRRSASCGRA